MVVEGIRHEVVEQELQEADDNGEQHQNEGLNSGIHHSESTGHGHDTDEDDEGDENPRPTKQRRLFLAPPDMSPTPALEQSSPKPCLARPRGATPSSTTQLEIGDAQSQTGLAHPPTSVKNDHHYAPPSSPSPSDTRSRHQSRNIRNGPSQEVLSTTSRESSVEAAVSRRAVTSRKPGKELTKNQESRFAKMVHDDKTWEEIGGHFPGHTLQLLKENFFMNQGGKPRKRGRKPGVKAVGVLIMTQG